MKSIDQVSPFADRVLRLLERVEYRRAETGEEKESIFRMRHDAYARAGTVPPQASGLFHDIYDEAPNVWLVGVFIDGDLASALRLHVSASISAPLPAMAVYPDILAPHLRAGRLIIDGSRLSSKLEYSLHYPEIPYITLRPTFMANDFFDADYLTAACRVDHQSFYLRMLMGVPWAAPRPYPGFNRPMAFVAFESRRKREALHARFPFYGSSEAERQKLFGRSSNRSDDVLRAIGRQERSEVGSA